MIQKLAFDGQTTGPEAAVQVLKAEKAQQAKIAAELDEDAPAPAPNAKATAANTQAAPKGLPGPGSKRCRYDYKGEKCPHGDKCRYEHKDKSVNKVKAARTVDHV